MDNAVSDRTELTAVDDLENDELLANAHLTGLKKLITAFDLLYAAMPPAQKKIAGDVLLNYGHERAASNG